jgi:hypothetical protein
MSSARKKTMLGDSAAARGRARIIVSRRYLIVNLNISMNVNINEGEAAVRI